MKNIGDFVYECLNYEHSKEHYELMKECAELTLIQQFLEDQRFLQENYNFITSGEVVFNENYFMELMEVNDSTSERNLSLYEATLQEKIDSIRAKVKTGLANLIRKIITVYKKIIAKYTELSEDVKFVVDNIGDITIDKDILVLPYRIQSFAISTNKTIPQNLKFTDFFNTDEGKVGKARVIDAYMSLVDSVLVVNHETLDKVYTNAIPIDEISHITNVMLKGKKSENDVKREIESINERITKKGLEIINNPEDIQKQVKRLNDIYNSLDNSIKNEQADDPEFAKALQQMYSFLMSSIGSTLNLYNKFMSIRHQNIEAFTKYIKK